MTLYEQIAQDLADKIHQGYYKQGSKLPSMRALAQERQASLSTIQESYRLLEEQGYARAKPKSGYYVCYQSSSLSLPEVRRPVQRPLDIGQWDLLKQTLHLMEPSGRFLGRSVARGAPILEAKTLKPLRKLIADSARYSDANSILSYGDPRGLHELRVQIARLCLNSGTQLHPDDLIITHGCQEALMCALRVCTSAGGIVAVDSPSFYGTLQAIKAAGIKVLEIPTHPTEGISIEALGAALERWPIQAILICPTNQNPLGYSLSVDKRQALLRLAQSHDIAIVEDDIYGDLSFRQPRPPSIKSMDSEGRVMLCSSLSKTLGPGLRLGWLAAGRYGEQALHARYVSSAGSSNILQAPVAQFLSSGQYERHVRAVTHRYQVQKEQTRPLLERYLPEGTRMSQPQGGYQFWIELPSEIDTLALHQRVLEQMNIGLAPGPLFSASGRYRNCMRFNYVHTVDERLESLIREIGEHAKALLTQSIELK